VPLYGDGRVRTGATLGRRSCRRSYERNGGRSRRVALGKVRTEVAIRMFIRWWRCGRDNMYVGAERLRCDLRIRVRSSDVSSPRFRIALLTRFSRGAGRLLRSLDPVASASSDSTSPVRLRLLVARPGGGRSRRGTAADLPSHEVVDESPGGTARRGREPPFRRKDGLVSCLGRIAKLRVGDLLAGHARNGTELDLPPSARAVSSRSSSAHYAFPCPYRGRQRRPSRARPGSPAEFPGPRIARP